MDFKQEYGQKSVTAAEAVKAVKSGDWIDYGWTTTTPVAFDKELAKIMPNLKDLNIRGGILMWEPEIFKLENAKDHFTWNSWHMGGIERKL